MRDAAPRLLAVCLALTFSATAAQAQYFGRNKVQYKEFKFEVLKTEHFEVYFYPQERDAAVQASRMAERWHARLSELFQHTLKTPQPLVLYASHPDFQQTNVVQGDISEGTGGVTEGLKQRVVLPFAATLAETDHVLGHELVHAYQYDIANRRGGEPGAGLERLPLWFVEGMAEYLSLGHIDPHTAMWIRDAAHNGELPTIGQLGKAKYFPYRWGQAFWAYVAGRWGDEVVGRVFRAAVEIGDPEDALKQIVGVSAKEVSTAWHEAIHAQYAVILKSTEPPGAYGRAITGVSGSSRTFSVSPALSPDGSRIVYLSERDLLSVDLYLAEADTGRIIRKLVNTAVDPHFSSLQFIGSAGSWHPENHLFAFGAIRNGHPELAIIDVDTGRVTREIPFPALGEVLNPAWSPDGRQIAFSATTGGYSDLFVFDLESGLLRQITQDPYGDLQPSWSPDGRRIAFATDRFSTELPTLKAGVSQLALIDPASGSIERLTTFDRGKSINPQWAPDGRRVYFLSDCNSITNVYVVEVAGGRVGQVTNLGGGASGITALSPALSVPIDANRLAFSAYEKGGLRIYIVDGVERLRGTDVKLTSTATAGILPPEIRASNQVGRLLDDAGTGLPAAAPEVKPYGAGLSLDYVGQPYVGVGRSAFGTSIGGGIALQFSDMLGNHNLFTAVDVNSYGRGFSDIFKNTGAVVAYQNLKRRWNWGVAAQQVPYVAGGLASGVSTANGQPALVEQEIIQRQIFRGVNGGVAYPFSQVRRIEFGAGYQQVTFEQQVRTITTSLRTGNVLGDETDTTSLTDALHLGSVTAAAVYDSSVFGATSPVAGQRSRLEVTPTVGSLSFVNGLADYRRYFMPARFYTLAVRGIHAGRYGSDSEDSRLLPLFLGYPDLVRGYGIGSFLNSECTANATGSCQEFDRLLGSRILVGNVEFRFPLLRPFGVSHGVYGPVPVEVALFADGGVAWNRSERPALLGGSREGVASAGVTFRVNLLGFAVAQIDFARPFQRPGRGWFWTFSLSPGF